MSIENAFKKLFADMAAERSATQMTLGELIVRLQHMPGDTRIQNVGLGLASYRGYYRDLAFPPRPGESVAAWELLETCTNALGRVFEGYKGGEYTMTKSTPLWLAHWGSCGRKIMSLGDDGTFEIVEDAY